MRRTETRRGQRDERLGTTGHGFVDTLPAVKSRGRDDPGVRGVAARAGGADRFPSVLAGDLEGGGFHFPGREIHRFAAQANRVRALTGSFDLAQETLAIIPVHTRRSSIARSTTQSISSSSRLAVRS